MTAIGAVIVRVLLSPLHGWAGALIGQPAAWTMPLAFGTVVLVSKLTPARVPLGTARSMVRLDTPEAVDVDRGLPE